MDAQHLLSRLSSRVNLVWPGRFIGTLFRISPSGDTMLPNQRAESGKRPSTFIDDCPEIDIWCYTHADSAGTNPVGVVSGVPTCWSWEALACKPCHGVIDDYCQQHLTNCADGGCIGKTVEEIRAIGTSH